ncbi:MAG TPA: protein BatD [Pseudomonas xinjiangensis]|uniref:Protein BatD n=2 Tax=root TaxID=1 RepID=A0A7V1BQS7_9GAMM|nr:protein BatD [Halopseudomonas xinjiangensis]HEC46189.1 protein BatD [Halopseudomonas xinjiangensis]
MTRPFLLYLVLLLCPTLAHADLEASVDRTRLVEGETLEFTLESAAASRFARPDFTPLEEHFEIQGSRQLSLISKLDGRAQPVTRWIITLSPKRTGFVVIPPVRLEEMQSKPISLEVLSASQAAQDTVAQMGPVFIDSEVDTETPYVQAQVLLTLRVYHSVSLYDDSTLSGLEIPNARVESLGSPQHYERLINGVRHGVIEVRYAVFAQQSGDLEIPSQLFSATILQARDPSARFSARTGKVVQVRSPSIILEVQPIPENYPSGAPWIPASQVNLSQQWQPDPGIDLLSGEPLTRTLTLEAEGLSASQLPVLHSLPDQTAQRLRLYADQPKLENKTRDSGVRGLRQDSVALVAQSEGSYQLPAVEVHWWDTQLDSLQTARLDAVTLNVSSDQNFTSSLPETVISGRVEPQQYPAVWPWQVSSVLLSLALGFSLLLLHRARRALTDRVLPEEQENLDDEIQGNPLGDLQAACRGNHPGEARRALEAWARQQDPDGLVGLAPRHPELSEALDNLNACLFGHCDTPWRGKPLWRAVRVAIQTRKKASEAPPEQLASLYPDV